MSARRSAFGVPVAGRLRCAAPAASRRAGTAVLAVPVVVVVAAILVVARNGAYASPDSAFYVGVARSLRDGLDLVAPPGSQPLAHFPPLFPVLLAAAAAVLGLDPLDAAAVANPLLAGATGLLVGLVVRGRTGSAAWGAAAAAAVMVARESLVYGASALSEPLFVLLAVAGLVALATSIDRRSEGLLAGATVLVGLACLTRYAGAALIVAGAAALVRFEGAPGRRRALVFTAGAAAPLALWLAAVGRTNRRVSLHLFDAEYWTIGADALTRWVAPAFLPWPVRAAVAPAVAVAVWRVSRGLPRRAPAGGSSPASSVRARSGEGAWPAGGSNPPSSSPAAAGGGGLAGIARGGDPLPFVLGAFTAAYLALLVADRLLLDASGRLDGRFLLPLHAMAVLALAPVLARAAAGAAGRAVIGVGVGLLALHAVQAASWAVSGVTDDSLGRRGLTARAWTESPVVAAVAGLPPSVPVYTNAADALFLHTGRRATTLPAHRDLLAGEPRPTYGRELAAMARRLRQEGGVVVYVAPFAFRELFLPGPDEIAHAVALEPVDADGIAAIYRPVP